MGDSRDEDEDVEVPDDAVGEISVSMVSDEKNSEAVVAYDC